ncbi:response regulator transcription factor [Streptosporangium sp. NPDC004379]|uniref:response regulator transcription factor n=1 Tax=Streptosporangium sp. NPDC004379 TaxID=3366189 RepID=UPI00369F2F49
MRPRRTDPGGPRRPRRTRLPVTARGPSGPRHGGAGRRRAPAALTAREADILAPVAQGLSSAQVARRVHMTEAGVKTYVSRILTRLDCANRVQAALLLHDAPLPS